MTDLAAWLIDRIAEDEEVARAAMPGPWFATEHELWTSPIVCENHWPGLTEEEAAEYGERPGPPNYVVAQTLNGGRRLADAAHIARHDPARVLAECAAKRRIVKAYEFETDTPPDGTDQPPAMALRLLALPYSDRDGYDPAWAPE